MTDLGASSIPTEVIQAMSDVMPKFVNVTDLQHKASAVISEVIGSEAGCITASAAAAIAVSTAACMTGLDLYKAEELPTTTGMKNEVIIQRGHVAWYGAPVRQLVRMTGAELVEIGDVARTGLYQLRGAINENTAAALFVVSHHTDQYGMIALKEFCDEAHAYGVPVIVDAASESEMHTFIEAGADLVCFSGHKFLAGPTSGIIAGRRDLIRACLMHQTAGIGRPMKVGKEGIAGVIAALRRWQQFDHRAIKVEQERVAETFIAGLNNLAGVTVSLSPDPTGNPIDRVKVAIDADTTGLDAHELTTALKGNNPPIVVRNHHAADEGFIFLDPCNVDVKTANYVAERITEILKADEPAKQQWRTAAVASRNDADALANSMHNWLPTEAGK